MAAEENRMPSADPEEARILAFLGRLAKHDAALPPLRSDGADAGPEGPPDGAGAEDGAPAPDEHRR
jgi:hypothetical protein